MTPASRSLLSLDATSGVPVFVQIRDQVKCAVADGRLTAGSRLPTTRALAEELGVAVNTVAKAYRELEREAVVEGRGRQGTFVTDQEGTVAEREAARFVSAVRLLGLSRERALALVEHAWL